MADESVTKEGSQVEHKPVNVFVHVSTTVPVKWTEEEFSTLMDTWQDVVERTRYATRRFNVAQRILKRYRRKGVETITIDIIRKQIKKLRTEYEVYKGLVIIGIETYRAPCVDQLELILDKIPSTRRRLYPRVQRARSFSEGTADTLPEKKPTDEVDSSVTTLSPEPNEVASDREALVRGKPRFQRISGQRLFKMLIEQQQSVMDRLEKLFKAIEVSNTMMVNLVDTISPQRKMEDVTLLTIDDKA